MKQSIPHSHNDLLSAAATAIKGALRHAGAIQLAYNNAAVLQQSRLEAVQSREAFDGATLALLALQAELKQFTAEARAFAMLARDVLKPALGRSFNDRWPGAGFARSLEVPERAAELELLMESLKEFLARNPGREVSQAGVTAARAGELHSGLKIARHAVQTKRTERRALGRVRRERFLALRMRLAALARELLQVISKTDPRWLDYGLNIPGAPERPEAPAGVTVAAVGEAVAAVKWERAARAERYHVYLQMVGEDKIVRVATVEDTDCLIDPLPRDRPVGVFVVALNAGGESARSWVVEFS